MASDLSSAAPTPDGVSLVLSSIGVVSPVLQVLDLKPQGNSRYITELSDGMRKVRAILANLNGEIHSGRLLNLGLIMLQDYIVNAVSSEKVLNVSAFQIVKAQCESEFSASVMTALVPKVEPEVPARVKEEAGDTEMIEKKPKVKEEAFAPTVKSASQIIKEQSGCAVPAIKKGISRRVYPLVSLNPYESIWTIKVRVTSKGPMRSFSNARGSGNLFNVELTDEEGTQIQATMFKEAADEFHPKLELGKLYYVSNGILKAANKRYSNLKNDYEMTLTTKSTVEEIPEEDGADKKIPLVKFSFVKIEEMAPYVNGRELIDVIGVVQSVGSNMSIRRKSNNEEIPKRDITIADESNKTVVISLWNDLATDFGAKLLNMVDEAPVVAFRSVRVGDYQGISLSSISKSTVIINPEIPEAKTLREWYDDTGRSATMAPAGANLPGRSPGNVGSSAPAERAKLADVVLPEVGEGKPVYFTVRACISFIKPDQAMWYLACTTCNRKVIQESESSYWCEGCSKHYDTCNRRYIMLAKISDCSGEAWISAFNEQAETILGHSAESLNDIRLQDSEQKEFQRILKGAAWESRMMRISVQQHEYMSEKRQRITVRSVSPVDWAAESRLLLEKLSSLS
ncbi:hypothetical protein R1sor_021179 [Riccia sorocarpa]|uniref:Replication protein A subunit n=1 Tax=Riccia sorocarpa TaxID=122646 RepID=A0ABD3GGB4_9MARC